MQGIPTDRGVARDIRTARAVDLAARDAKGAGGSPARGSPRLLQLASPRQIAELLVGIDAGAELELLLITDLIRDFDLPALPATTSWLHAMKALEAERAWTLGGARWPAPLRSCHTTGWIEFEYGHGHCRAPSDASSGGRLTSPRYRFAGRKRTNVALSHIAHGQTARPYLSRSFEASSDSASSRSSVERHSIPPKRPRSGMTWTHLLSTRTDPGLTWFLRLEISCAHWHWY